MNKNCPLVEVNVNCPDDGICQSKRIEVAGVGCVVFPLSFEPTEVAAEFCDNQSNSHPSCVPVPIDMVSSTVVPIDNGYGVKVCWEVADQREVKWVACGHSR